MPDTYLGRFNRWIEKLFNVKGGPTVVDVSHQVLSTLSLDKGVDHRYLEGWNRFAVVNAVAALAANFGRVRIRNAAGSNVMIVLEQLNTFSGSAVADSPLVAWGAVSTDLANLQTLTFTRMDPRGNPQPTAIVSFNAQASGGQPLLQRIQPAGNGVDFINNPNQEIPILPGQSVDIQSNTANTQLTCGLMWRERPLESSELA